MYISPTRALAQEKVRDWQARLGPALKLRLAELTGDTSDMAAPDAAELDNADLICTTPEKLDAVTRRNAENGGMR